MWIEVGNQSDFAEGAIRIVTVNSTEVGIIRWEGELYAMRNVCPHQAGPICGGIGPKLIGIGGVPGSMDIDPNIPVMECAWHGWEFDVRTGAAVWDESYKVQTYPVKVESDRVLIDLGRKRT